MNFADQVLRQTAVENRPKLKPSKPKYSVYQRQNGRWVRVSALSFEVNQARKVFQDFLLGSVMSGAPELRLMPTHGDEERIGEYQKAR